MEMTLLTPPLGMFIAQTTYALLAILKVHHLIMVKMWIAVLVVR